MNLQTKQADTLYKDACLAQKRGKMDLAEVYFLKSASGFEQAGGTYATKSAQSLNALAHLRLKRGNYQGAMYSAKRSVQIVEMHRSECDSLDAELALMQAWEMIESLVSMEISSLELSASAV